MQSLLESWQNWRINRQIARYSQQEVSGYKIIGDQQLYFPNVNRRLSDKGGYIDVLKGAGHMLQYVQGLSCPTILDVGTGKGSAVRQLRESFYGERLRFMGTGLVEYPETIANLGGKQNFRQTSAEFLEGVDDVSIGGIIGVYSIAHSKFGGRIARQFDRVLVEGGAIKVNFHNNDRTMKSFVRTLKRRGYDVSTAWKPHMTDSLPHVSILVVAVKPRPGDTPFTTTAKSLMEQDVQDCERQNAVYLRRF